jgi:hypothetical protein
VLADGSAPILRREVVAAVAAAIGPGPSGGEPVRIAMDAEPEQRGIHGRLHSFGVLPASFSTTAVGGVTQAEGASILAKAAFIAGRIHVDGDAGSGWQRSDQPEYLRHLGNGEPRPCIESDGSRAAAVGFPLTQPDLNDDLWWRLRMLAGVGTRQSGRMQWLLTGRPAEFGVAAGQLEIDAADCHLPPAGIRRRGRPTAHRQVPGCKARHCGPVCAAGSLRRNERQRRVHVEGVP